MKDGNAQWPQTENPTEAREDRRTGDHRDLYKRLLQANQHPFTAIVGHLNHCQTGHGVAPVPPLVAQKWDGCRVLVNVMNHKAGSTRIAATGPSTTYPSWRGLSLSSTSRLTHRPFVFTDCAASSSTAFISGPVSSSSSLSSP